MHHVFYKRHHIDIDYPEITQFIVFKMVFMYDYYIWSVKQFFFRKSSYYKGPIVLGRNETDWRKMQKSNKNMC